MALSYVASTSALMISSAAQLLTFAILARSLGAEQFGLLVTVTVVTNIAAQICTLGANETLIRRVAPEPELYAVALGHNLILLGASGFVLTAGLGAVLPQFVTLSPEPAQNASALLALVFGNLVLVRLALVAEQAFIARWQIWRANLANIGFALGRTAAAAIACGMFHVSTTLEWAYWSAGSLALMAVIALLAIRPLGAPRWTIMREEVPLGIHFTTPFVFRAFRQNADTLVLSTIASPETVGAFNMARRVVEAGFLTAEALNRLIYPRLARAAASSYRALLPMIGPLMAASLALGIVTALGLYLMAPLMPLVFGADFQEMVVDLRVMCWVLAFVVLQGVPVQVLGAMAEHRLRAHVNNIGNLAGAALSAGLTYLYFLPGTFLALYLTEALLALALWLALRLVVRRRREKPPSGAQTKLPGGTPVGAR